MISVPPYLAGAALLFWGWQTGNWLPAAALAVAVEAARRTRLRFDLGAAEHSRIADLCTILFTGLAAVLAVNRGIAQGILGAFQWLPVALAPILLAQMVSQARRIPLSALFRYLRKMKRRDPAIRDPLVDTSPVYVALVLIAAGIANAQGPAYFGGVAVAVAWGLFAVRPRRAHPALWTLMLAAGLAGGYAGHIGLVQLRDQAEAWLADWFLRGLAGDPYRATTEIGAIGRAKLLDAIVLRIYARPAEGPRLRLLHRASYNTYVAGTWLARGAPMQPVAPDPGGLSWTLGAVPSDASARIAARIERGRILLSLPAQSTRVTGLGARTLRRNSLGAVHAEIPGDWIQYEAELAPAAELAEGPAPEDLAVPASERATFDAVAGELGLRGLPAEQALRRVREHFAGFTYSLWRERPAAAGVTPLADFMRNTRTGHCEYFAAATTLLLRAAGIPARYATGFAVVEYSALEDAYVVRARHAHAWARAWDGSRWAEVDTTPPSWFQEEEASLAPFWQKLADLGRWAAFRWSQRGELQASDGWYVALALLVAVLGWRLLRGRRVAREAGRAQEPPRVWPGADSEFFQVANARPRLPAELGPAFDEALRLHRRYRFDPLGLDAAARARLKELCALLASSLSAARR